MLRIVSLAVVCSLTVAPSAPATIIEMTFSAGTQNVSAFLRLFHTASPESVENFLTYAGVVGGTDLYTGTFVHRATGGFVIQGGGYVYDTSTGDAFSIPRNAPIPDEPGGGVPGISNTVGTISFAKSGPDSVTSEWFVNLADNSFLDDPTRPDGGFNAFGRVIFGGISLFDSIDNLGRITDTSDPIDVFGASFSFSEVPTLSLPQNPTPNQIAAGLVISTGVTVLNVSAGDYNLSGTVDGSDYDIWVLTFGNPLNAEADGNGDAFTTAADYTVWRDLVGQQVLSAAVTSATVPEPATKGGLLVAAAALLMHQRSRRPRHKNAGLG